MKPAAACRTPKPLQRDLRFLAGIYLVAYWAYAGGELSV